MSAKIIFLREQRRRRPQTCRSCGAINEQISFRALCHSCGTQRVRESVLQLQQRRGPIYQKWLAGMKNALKKA